jgi:hypothetical protein
MSIVKNETIDKIEIDALGVVYARKRVSVVEDGQEISGNYNRWTIAPGQDYSQEDGRIKAICAAVHTPEVVAQYQQLQNRE